eukprot:TRINITY_DN16772_c0_g1_i1.p1 TRINITY_DN16772_c0_g1~~TRINITY_DN16772_c0_g1_i1.p1  ORF type:complete len:289 (-),score=62.99 TRINITY_DN16772_c0_g1_i1:204-1070(-)
MTTFSALKNEVLSKEQRRQHYQDYVKGLNAYDRHKRFVEDYVKFYGDGRYEPPKAPVKTDTDILRESYRFLRSDEDDADTSWEARLAKRYYDKLFKEYCIADLSRYKESKVGLRWRTEKEVVAGKGQFICGNKEHGERNGLRSYEVNFAYKEAGEEKNALVKLRLCPKCAYKLNYRKEKELARQQRKEERRARKRRRKDGKDRKEEADSDQEPDPDDEAASPEEGGGGSPVGQPAVSPRGEGETSLEAKTHTTGGTLPADDSIWTGKKPEVEPSKEEEYDEYFRDMFL